MFGIIRIRIRYYSNNLGIRIRIRTIVALRIIFIFVFGHNSEPEKYSYSYSVLKTLFAHLCVTTTTVALNQCTHFTQQTIQRKFQEKFDRIHTGIKAICIYIKGIKAH